MSTVEKQLTLFRSVCLMQALAENIDELKNTPVYKQSLKNRLNHLEGDLRLYLNTLSALFWEQDEEIMMLISRGIDKVTEALATWHPSQLAVLEDALNQIEEQFKQIDNEQVQETAEPTGSGSVEVENELPWKPINGRFMRRGNDDQARDLRNKATDWKGWNPATSRWFKLWMFWLRKLIFLFIFVEVINAI